MNSHLKRDLENLHRLLLHLSAKVEALIHDGVEELIHFKSENIISLATKDDEIDKAEIQLVEECLKSLALNQPVASDLRRIATIMKMASELERIGDLAVNISERAISLHKLPRIDIPYELKSMSELAMSMLHYAVDAYVQENSTLARNVCKEDETVDRLNRKMIEFIVTTMQQKPELVEPYMHLFSCVKHLERIGDHATNIAEHIVYLVEGDIVRSRRTLHRPTG